MARYGDNHKGGRPTKAEQMGLEKRMNKAFQAVTKGEAAYGATRVIEEMFKIAFEEDNPKRFDALKWLTDRYFGKEPKPIHQEINVSENLGIEIKDYLKNAYGETNNKSDIQTTTDE